MPLFWSAIIATERAESCRFDRRVPLVLLDEADVGAGIGLVRSRGVAQPVRRGAAAPGLSSQHATLGGGMDQATAFFEHSLNAQAAMLGLNDIFWLSSMIFIAIIPLVWLTKPAKGAGAGAAGAH